METNKSHFWSYKIYSSRRQRRQNGAAETNWCGPFYFEEETDFLSVKKWIREHLGLNDTSHIDCRISRAEKRNSQAKKVHFDRKKIELEREAGLRGKSTGARPGNLIVEWLKPELKA